MRLTLVLLAALAAPVRADISTATPARQLTTADLARFYAAWFTHAYEHMFDDGGPALSVNGREFHRFRAGIGGIVRYGGLTDAAARFLDPAKGAAFGDLRPIERLAGRRIFLGESRVNPEFVRWAVQNTVPAPDTKILDHTAKEYYDVVFSRFFRMMAAAHAWLDAPGRLARESAAYVKAQEHAGFDGIEYLQKRYTRALTAYNVPADGTAFTPQMAIGFWLRRHADGTAPELWAALQKLLAAYDPGFKARADGSPAP